jgi:NitT/TauT family transport system substrate-binding protein
MRHAHVRRSSFLSAVGALTALPRALSGQALTKVRIAGTPDQDMIGSFWAQQNGIFQKYGIDADVTTLTSGAAITAAVVGGSLDIGRSSLFGLIAARAKGVPFVLVASSILYNAAKPNSALIVAKDSSIRTGRDLNDSTVAVSALGDFYAVMDSAWIDAHGGDSRRVHYVEIPGRTAADAVSSGRVAATTLADPMLSQMLASGHFRILDHPFNAAANVFVLTAYFCTADYAAKNAAVLARFRRALTESVAFVNAHRPAVLPVMSKYTGVDEATLAAMSPIPLAPPGQLDSALIQPLIDVAVKYKVIDHGFAAKEMIDPGL